MLLNPPADSWPAYHGTYDGQRHSKLEQITPQNVGSLALAWAFQTNQKRGHQIHPAAGRRGAVLYRSGQGMGGRCPLGSPVMALHLPA